MSCKISGRKSKGKAFEKKVADLLHDFLYQNVIEYRKLFDECGNDNLKPKRDSSSGTFKNSDNDIDLGIAKKFFPFSIECKHNILVNKLTITSLLKNNLHFIRKTFKQAQEHALKSNLTPMIIMRGNHTSDIVVVENTPEFHKQLPKCKIRLIVNDLIIFELNEFLKSYFSI